MPKRSVEIFLAHRLGAPKENEGANTQGRPKGSAMPSVATVAVAVSMAVMIVALAVVGGFESALMEKMAGLTGHLTIERMATGGTTTPQPLTRNAEFEAKVSGMDHFGSISAWAGKVGVLKSRTAMQGVMLRGEEEGYDSLFFKRSLTAGALPRIGGEQRRKDVLLSQSMAVLLEVGVGDKVEVVFMGGEVAVRRDAYKVCGIYSTGMESLEQQLAITDLRNVQRLNDWAENEISGYHVSADHIGNMEALGGEVRVEALHAGGNELWRTYDLIQAYPQIFNWLATHDVNAVVIIVIMLAVALLNMITALLIIIFERIRMIGTLKTLGMRNGAIQRVFLWRSLAVILKGMAWGNAVGVFIVLVQGLTGLVRLDPEAYLLSAVPVEWGWDWWLGLNVLSPMVLVLLLSIPVAVVARIKPDQTLRFR